MEPCRGGRLCPPVPAAADSPLYEEGGQIAEGNQGEFVNRFSPSHGLRRDSPLYQEGAFGGRP